MKHDAIVDQGIPIHERVPIPDEMIPADSRVEIDAKIQAGYFTTGNVMSMEELANVKGRGWEDIDVRVPPMNHKGLIKLTATVALSRPCDLGRMQGREAASSDDPAQQSSSVILLTRCRAWTHSASRTRVAYQMFIQQSQSIKRANTYYTNQSTSYSPQIDDYCAHVLLPSRSSPQGLPQPLTSSHMTLTIGGPNPLTSSIRSIPDLGPAGRSVFL